MLQNSSSLSFVVVSIFFEKFLSHICYFAEKERERVGFGSPPSDSFLLSYFNKGFFGFVCLGELVALELRFSDHKTLFMLRGFC